MSNWRSLADPHHPADTLYFDGNSLGLQSDTARAAVLGTLQNWAELGVMGWTETSPPWFTWVERVSAQIAGLLGAVDGEITLGSSTTVMLHQLLATLHPSSGSRWKVLMDSSAFPTDRYAVASFLQGRGHNPRSSLVLVEPRSDRLLHAEDIVRLAGTDVALAVLPSVVFTTGQTLPMEELTRDLRERGVQVIWDLSHSAGLLPHQLHWDRIDAAVFCTYKYLNGGPGAPGGAFIHQSLWPVQPGLQGWWGSANERQFDMTAEFLGAGNAHALQLGTPSILALSALAGSVSLLSEVGIEALHRRALDLVSFLDALVRERLTPLGISVLTPSGERGGGISLKPGEGMGRMKGDMGGAAAVVGAIRAIARQQLPVNVLAVLPLAENLPGGGAYRPGDVLTMMDGTLVEIISTDAEGRLVLADGVSWASNQGAAAIVDIATLTGANVVALGGIRSGLLTNDERLADIVKEAADRASEPTWELPHDEDYIDFIKTSAGDIKNSGGRPAGTITAGLFIRHFARSVPWAHLDIAGLSFAGEGGTIGAGATGYGVATLVEICREFSAIHQ